MNRLLAAASALAVLATAAQASAADLAARAPVYTKAPVIAPVPSWSGWYVGGNVGYGWGSNTMNDAFVPSEMLFSTLNGSLNNNTSGVFGGGQFGYNWQMNNFLAGFEADIQGSGIKGSSQGQLAGLNGIFSNDPADGRISNQKLSWFGTVRGRLGFTVVPSLLLFGTGGLAYGQVNATGNTTFDFGEQVLANLSTTKVGWTAGVGAEWMFAPSWSAKVEYLHIDLGSVSAFAADNQVPVGGVNYTFQNKFDTVRAGVNYHFN